MRHIMHGTKETVAALFISKGLVVQEELNLSPKTP